jgi:XTP/dITP diphosphohydrolase
VRLHVLVATTNANKVREIRPVLADLPVVVLTLADVAPIREPEESATTYWENARLKAFGYARVAASASRSDEPPIVVAEDSGLEIDALGGIPGVHSARFLGTDVPYPARFAELYKRLQGVPSGLRTARFVTALAAVRRNGIVFETETAIEGVVAERPAGEHGFGYDPIFYYAPLQKTTAEMTIEEKCMVSHRARAFRDFSRWLRHAELT